jgi:hypothetical protein
MYFVTATDGAATTAQNNDGAASEANPLLFGRHGDAECFVEGQRNVPVGGGDEDPQWLWPDRQQPIKIVSDLPDCLLVPELDSLAGDPVLVDEDSGMARVMNP